jgi:hypothetical protein
MNFQTSVYFHSPAYLWFKEGNFNKTNRPAYRQAGCFVVPPRKDTLILGLGFVGNGY